jgi:protein-disulfide isomerase
VKIRLIDVLAIVSTVCAVTVTSVVLLGRASGSPAAFSTGQVSQEPVLLENWEELARVGHRTGNPSAPVTIVEFSDFECPFCARFASSQIPALRKDYADQVQFVFRHWPLPNHRFAYPAARAAECAALQGRFWEFHDAVFAAQDSLGLLTFAELAGRAGVPDPDAFNVCNSEAGQVEAIERDNRVAGEIGATGTPTVIVNGWRLKGTPSLEVLDSIIRAQLAERK